MKEKQQYFIKFNPYINKITGCQRATLVLSSLEYWFTKKPDGYYKFIEPCTHRLYREGDSFVECLGIPRKSFWRSFKKIGTKHNSRTAFDDALDKFQGKMYASYYDRYSNRIFFVRNNDLANELLKPYIKIKNPASPKITHQKLLVSATQEPFGNGHNDLSYIESKNTSNDLSKDKSHADSEIQKKMIELWVQIVEGGRKSIEITRKLLAFLRQAFKDKFESNLENWKSYCERIASSKFLMGEIKCSFRATIDWALKFDIIQKIFDGNYGIGDRNPSLVPLNSQVFLNNSEKERTAEEDEICNMTDEPEVVKVFRLKWLNQLGAKNYREYIKDCGIEVKDDVTVILRPSSRYNAKLIASYWSPKLLVGSSLRGVNIVNQEGDLVFDKWFGEEQTKRETPLQNKTNDLNVTVNLASEFIHLSEIPQKATTIIANQPIVSEGVEGIPEKLEYSGDQVPKGMILSTPETLVTPETEMLRKKLREFVNPQKFPSWLGTIEVETMRQDGTVVVALEDSLAVDWCRSRFSEEILRSATSLWGCVNSLLIVEKLSNTISSSVEKTSKDIKEKSTFEQAIQSFLEVCYPSKSMMAHG